MSPLTQAFLSRKNVGVAYLLWFFFAYLGAHKFYLRRPMMGVLYIALFMFVVYGTTDVARWLGDFRRAIELGGPSLIYEEPNYGLLGMTYLAIVGLGLAYFYDLFTLPWQVDDANARLLAEAQQNAPMKSRHDDDGGLAAGTAEKADALIAQYLAQRAQAATQQQSSKPGGAPTFGKRK